MEAETRNVYVQSMPSLEVWKIVIGVTNNLKLIIANFSVQFIQSPFIINMLLLTCA